MVMERMAAGAALAAKLEARTARVAVLGLGYAGLPMAVAVAQVGHSVLGLDVDPIRAAAVAAGQSPVTDVADADVQQLVAAGRINASTDMALLAECDVALIAVPTPLGSSQGPGPELHSIRRAESGPVPAPRHAGHSPVDRHTRHDP